MEPAFYRGDLLFLTNPAHGRYHTGDITVYKIPGAEIPIVHRVLETHDILPTVKNSHFKYAFFYLLICIANPNAKVNEIGARVFSGSITVDER